MTYSLSLGHNKGAIFVQGKRNSAFKSSLKSEYRAIQKQFNPSVVHLISLQLPTMN